MKIFLSYASEDRALVEPIYLALRAQGHKVFFDRADLPPGEEYDSRIRQAIERSQLLIFFLSPAFLDAGSYTLTELHIAQKTWEHPAGKLLPVVLRPIELDQVPPYLKSVTFLEPEGNVTATVADAVHRIALARRRKLLKNFAKGFAAVILIGLAGYFYLAKREPSRQTTGKDGALAVLIPSGNFTMGDDEEAPLREIYVDAFYLDKYEVTTSRYAKFLQATGSSKPPEGWKK
jgi:formylglycine-generating enzyme required for sulfatase activity